MKLGTLSKEGQPHLGIVLGDKVLDLTELGRARPASCGLLAGAIDVSPLWSLPARSLVDSICQRVPEYGLPQDWEGFCEAADACTWLPPVAAPERSAGSVDEPAGTRKVMAADWTPGIRSASRVRPLGKECWK